jgi:chorismate mutase/prephenate dehydratase
MPDTTAPATPSAEAPPPEDGWRPDLTALRARLDEIDDKLHDLLMDRARVIESVARSGKAAVFRPGREAAILRRLLARHTGKLPAKTLVRMWREMLAGTTAMQTAVTIAVTGPGALTAMSHEHFGVLTPVIAYPSTEDAMVAVRAGTATVALLPFPTEADAWWPALTNANPRLHIIARLPFWTDGVPAANALVVGLAAPDASGIDRSFIVTPDRARLADAGLTPCALHGNVVEVDGTVTEDDPRLPADAIVLGGYAVPEAGEHA